MAHIVIVPLGASELISDASAGVAGSSDLPQPPSTSAPAAVTAVSARTFLRT
jgi:hypothetical protein